MGQPLVLVLFLVVAEEPVDEFLEFGKVLAIDLDADFLYVMLEQLLLVDELVDVVDERLTVILALLHEAAEPLVEAGAERVVTERLAVCDAADAVDEAEAEADDGGVRFLFGDVRLAWLPLREDGVCGAEDVIDDFRGLLEEALVLALGAFLSVLYYAVKRINYHQKGISSSYMDWTICGCCCTGTVCDCTGICAAGCIGCCACG